MAHINARLAQPGDHITIAQKYCHSGSSDNSFNDALDFRPTAYPVREFVIASVFVFALTVFMVWGGSRLLSLM
jgi:hypothetical protein